MSGRAVKVRITGRVQGVGFRAWACDEAKRIGLDGWVRNEPDGSVTALVAGPEEAVTLMLERFRQGPTGAAVTDVRAEAADTASVPVGFRITG